MLIDRARRMQTTKRGGDLERVPFERLVQEVATTFGYPKLEFMDLDAALDRLAETHPRKAAVIELMFFAGLTRDETADILDVAVRTVQNDWLYARLWLIQEMDRCDRTAFAG